MKELLVKDPSNVSIRSCLLKYLIPDKAEPKTKVEDVNDPLVKSFVTDYFAKSSHNPALIITKVQCIKNRTVQRRFINEL